MREGPGVAPGPDFSSPYIIATFRPDGTIRALKV